MDVQIGCVFWSRFRGKNALVAAVFFLWVAFVLFAFWLFQLQYTSTWVSFVGERLPARFGAATSLQVLHFVDDTCPCARFSEPHIKEVEAQWVNLGIEFSSVSPTTIIGSGVDSALVPASPAVAVWNQQGEIIFFGPYTSGAVCGEGEDLLAKVLDEPTAAGQWVNQEAIGCFCEWPNGVT